MAYLDDLILVFSCVNSVDLAVSTEAFALLNGMFVKILNEISLLEILLAAHVS